MNCPYPECGGEPAPAADECPVCHRSISACLLCAVPNRALARTCRGCGKPVLPNLEWPVYRNNPTYTAYSPSRLDFDLIPPSQQFERLWPDVSLGEEVMAPPVADHGLLVVCSRKGAVYVLNRFTGERLADVRLGEGECSALISGRSLIVAAARRIVAYDLLGAFQNWSNGRFRMIERWHFTVDSGPILHPPNKLARQGAESVLICCSAPDGTLVHCLDIESGEPRWQAPAAFPGNVSAAVSAEDGNAYVVASDRKIYRIVGDSGALEASLQMANSLRTDIAPAWLDSTLLFFDEEGALCACRTDTSDGMTPARVSELTLFGVKGFAASPRGVLVSHGRGLTKLSLGGQLIWRADPSMGGMSSSPVLAGDCGLGVVQNRSIVYICDFKGAFLRFHQFLVTEDVNMAPPAYAGRTLYSCSLHGQLNALRINTIRVE